MASLFAPLAVAVTLLNDPDSEGIQLLDQKLYFRLVGNDAVQVGDIVIGAPNLKIEITGTPQAPTLKLKGPLHFSNYSTFVIRDPNGIIIWRKEIVDKIPKDLHTHLTESLDQRVYQYEEKTGVSNLLEKLSREPYFNFCIFAERPMTRFNLCTPNYSVSLKKSVKSKTQSWTLKSVSSSQGPSTIRINNADVGEEGEVQFTSDITKISLVAKLATGALIEMKTQQMPLELVDYKFKENNALLKLVVRGTGTDLTDEIPKEWSPTVMIDKPYFYVDIESQIPLKQELVLPDNLSKKSFIPKIQFRLNKTYQQNEVIQFKGVSGTVIKPKTAGDKLIRKGDDYVWKFNNLKFNDINRHDLSIQPAGESEPMIVSWEIVRGRPLHLMASCRAGVTFNSDTNSQLKGCGISASYYLTKLPFVPLRPWHYLRWGFYFRTAMNDVKAEGGSVVLSEEWLGVNFKFNSGLEGLDKMIGGRVGFLRLTLDHSNLSGAFFGLSVKQNKLDSPLFGRRALVTLDWVPALTTDNISGGGGGGVQFLSYSALFPLQSSFEWLWGLDLLTISSSTGSTPSYLTLKLGLGASF